MKTKKRYTSVCILDVCFPDYFTGYHLPVIAIPVNNQMTNKDLSEKIKNKIKYSYDYLIDTFTEEEINVFFIYCNKLKRMKKTIMFPDFEESEDFEDSAYLYISLCKPVFKYGINFLNS